VLKWIVIAVAVILLLDLLTRMWAETLARGLLILMGM